MQKEVLSKVLSGKSLRSIFLTESLDSKPDLSSLGPNGLAVVKAYINHFSEQAYDDVEIGPEVDKRYPGWAFIILGNQEPAIMKAGKDISKKERDDLIHQIENW